MGKLALVPFILLGALLYFAVIVGAVLCALWIWHRRESS